MSSDVDVLILGGSFAGVEVVHQLLRLADRAPPTIAVVDRQAEHGYLPLVQERMVGTLAADETRLRTRTYVESVPGARYIQAEIEAFDPETKTVTLADGTTLRGRFVVIALGSVADAPTAIPGAEHLTAYKLESEFDKARASMSARLEADPEASLVVVGGGISGCELAGELACRSTGSSRPRVTLVSAGESVMPEFSNRVQTKAAAALRKQGVELRLGARVVEAHARGLVLRERGAKADETLELEAAATFWAGGIRPAPILAELGVPLDDDGWLRVGPTLQCFSTATPTHPDIFACGDAVRIYGGDGRWPTMQRAIECIWQAKVVAKNILRLADEPKAYPEGVPPLRPHKLRKTFFFGLSLGGRSFVVYRWLMLDIPGLNHWFRRWLMRQYFSRYTPLPGSGGRPSAD